MTRRAIGAIRALPGRIKHAYLNALSPPAPATPTQPDAHKRFTNLEVLSKAPKGPR